MNFSVFGEPIFNNLQTKFLAETLRKEFFNRHRRYRSNPLEKAILGVIEMLHKLSFEPLPNPIAFIDLPLART